MEEIMPACAQSQGDAAQSQAYVPDKLCSAGGLFFLSVLCENNPKKLDLRCLLTQGWP